VISSGNWPIQLERRDLVRADDPDLLAALFTQPQHVQFPLQVRRDRLLHHPHPPERDVPFGEPVEVFFESGPLGFDQPYRLRPVAGGEGIPTAETRFLKRLLTLQFPEAMLFDAPEPLVVILQVLPKRQLFAGRCTEKLTHRSLATFAVMNPSQAGTISD
jgi:hypothetical protein